MKKTFGKLLFWLGLIMGFIAGNLFFWFVIKPFF